MNRRSASPTSHWHLKDFLCLLNLFCNYCGQLYVDLYMFLGSIAPAGDVGDTDEAKRCGDGSEGDNSCRHDDDDEIGDDCPSLHLSHSELVC